MATTVPSHAVPTPLSYATAVKRLTLSHITRIEKINICHRLLSSHYHPDPSATVLNCLCSLIGKDVPSVDACYAIRNSITTFPEHAVHDWRLLAHALMTYIQRFQEHSDHRDAPLIPNAVLVQGGLHLLRGSSALQESAAKALHLIIKRAQYSHDLETHAWLFCAVYRAEGPSSVLAPLRTAILPQFSLIVSHEHDQDCVATAAAAISSHVGPSCLTSELEKIIVHAIRASPSVFHGRFAAWVLQNGASLPQAIQLLMRAYLKHPLRTNEERSSGKRTMQEPARQDALEFFEAISNHVLQSLRANGDQGLWDDDAFRCRMKAIQVLYLIGSENSVFLPLGDQLPGEEKRRKRARKGANHQSAITTGLHGVLRELISIAGSLHSETEFHDERVKLTFQAIGAVAKFSLDTIDELLPDVLRSCLTLKEQHRDTTNEVSNKCELFCILVLRYEQSRALDKFLGHLVNTGSLHSQIAILRQQRAQEALGAAFSHLREAEVQASIQALTPKSCLPAREISALTLIFSLLLETVAPSFIQPTAVAIANHFVDLLIGPSVSSENRHCRMHLLSSFFLASTANTVLSAEEVVRAAMLRLALVDGTEKVSNSEEWVAFQSVFLEALSSGQESMNEQELCSNLRCLTTFVHYSVQYHGISRDREFIARALQVTFAQFGILLRLFEKSNVQKNSDSLLIVPYDSRSYCLVLHWLGSLGNFLTRLSALESGKTEVLPFLSQALQFFPTTHPFWNALSEEPKWGSAVVKAAHDVLEKLSKSLTCAKSKRPCPVGRVLESISMMPSCFFVGPDLGELFHMILLYTTVPCCLASRLNALKACLNLSNTSRFREVLSTFLQGGCSGVQKMDHQLHTSPNKPPYECIIVTIRVVASQTPEKQVAFLSPELASLLKKAILGLKMACKRDLQPPISSQGTWCEAVGALLDLCASLDSAKDTNEGSDEMSIVQVAATECIKVAFPLCLKSIGNEVPGRITDSRAVDYMLSAMLKGGSPVYRRMFSDEECSALHDVLIRTYLPYLVDPQFEKRRLAILLGRKIPVFERSSRRKVCQVLLSLLDIVLRNVRRHLPFVLRGDEQSASETVSRLISTATNLTMSSAQLCNTSAFPLVETPEMASEGASPTSDSRTHAGWSFKASTRILSGLEEFLTTWSCSFQEISMRRMTKLQTSALLSNSESLVSSSLKACLAIFKTSRSCSRGDVEKIVLLSRQVVERVCSCEEFLRNEGDVLVTALRICRIAVKRHSGLVPSVSQVIGGLLRRGINTENMVILAAVREAVEDICTTSKTWEVLSALLADCSTALDETPGADSRREAEKSTAFLFKAVGERRAQQVLGCLKDSGRESLRQVWELFSDKMHYSGR